LWQSLSPFGPGPRTRLTGPELLDKLQRRPSIGLDSQLKAHTAFADRSHLGHRVLTDRSDLEVDVATTSITPRIGGITHDPHDQSS
jgi:hypothetical protein